MKFATIAAAAALLATSASAQDAQLLNTRVWTVETPKGGDAWLRYGTPMTNDQEAAFTCVPKSGQVQVIAQMTKALSARIPASVIIASGPSSVSLRGTAEPNSKGSLVTTEFSTRAPLTAAFKKTAVVSISGLGETLTLPPAAKGQVRKFFGVCK